MNEVVNGVRRTLVSRHVFSTNRGNKTLVHGWTVPTRCVDDRMVPVTPAGSLKAKVEHFGR